MEETATGQTEGAGLSNRRHASTRSAVCSFARRIAKPVEPGTEDGTRMASWWSKRYHARLRERGFSSARRNASRVCCLVARGTSCESRGVEKKEENALRKRKTCQVEKLIKGNSKKRLTVSVITDLFPDFFREVWSELIEALTDVLAPYEWEVEEEEEEVFWLVVEVDEFRPTKRNKNARTIKVRSSERELFLLGISGFMFE